MFRLLFVVLIVNVAVQGLPQHNFFTGGNYDNKGSGMTGMVTGGQGTVLTNGGPGQLELYNQGGQYTQGDTGIMGGNSGGAITGGGTNSGIMGSNIAGGAYFGPTHNVYHSHYNNPLPSSNNAECATPDWNGDGECDASNNNALCNFDGGDCRDSEVDCRKGDGLGGTEVLLNGNYTIQKCVSEVKKQHPTANGASVNIDCSNNCSCWAEFGMDRWSGSNYQACLFKEDCCDSIEIYYIGRLEYDRTSIYGYYIRQEDLINGRPCYKNDARSIWWNDEWILGPTNKKGGRKGSRFAYLTDNVVCLTEIRNQRWIMSNGNAGNKVKARCGYKPAGYGTSLCCSKIKVTLNGVIKNEWGCNAGIYQKASGMVNNRSIWNKISGGYNCHERDIHQRGNAIWYYNKGRKGNEWFIGLADKIGSSSPILRSAQDSACPTSENKWFYWGDDESWDEKWHIAPINLFSIRCI